LEIDILRPALILPIGKLAIEQFLEFAKLTDVIGKQFRVTEHGHTFDIIPLPHPSGASPWHRVEPGKTLLEKALRLAVSHPSWPKGPGHAALSEPAISSVSGIGVAKKTGRSRPRSATRRD
jgi:hypothetical protein